MGPWQSVLCSFIRFRRSRSYTINSIRLDGLPFLDGQFDFVRMVRMGLHVPEDEVSLPRCSPFHC